MLVQARWLDESTVAMRRVIIRDGRKLPREWVVFDIGRFLFDNPEMSMFEALHGFTMYVIDEGSGAYTGNPEESE